MTREELQQFNEVDSNKLPSECYQYTHSYGKYRYFMKQLPTGDYQVVKLVDSDLLDGNYLFMFKYNLSAPDEVKAALK